MHCIHTLQLGLLNPGWGLSHQANRRPAPPDAINSPLNSFLERSRVESFGQVPFKFHSLLGSFPLSWLSDKFRMTSSLKGAAMVEPDAGLPHAAGTLPLNLHAVKRRGGGRELGGDQCWYCKASFLVCSATRTLPALL
jgi:hypothetical protein